MPLEVVAQLDRESAVYLAGEPIHCTVLIANIGSEEEDPLAWCSVQLQCDRIIGAGGHEHVSKKSSTSECPRTESTSILRSASTVFSCLPVVLFCDLQLKPGEKRKFTCVQQLPFDGIPPSFKGYLVKYIYKLTIGVQHVRSPIKLFHIPLRVIQADIGLSLPSRVSLENPFIANRKVGPSVIDLTREAVDCLTAPQKSIVYSMTNSKGRVAKFTLYKKAFKLGEDVIGRFDFRECPVSCLQFTVSVQSVELTVNDEPPRSFATTHMTEHAVCAFWTEAFVKVHIPLSATPTFYTDSVHVKWRLHFEFVTCENVLNTISTEDGLCQAPKDIDIETMAWDLDIKVLPCSPFNAALTSPFSPNFASIIV
ncbi:hypothetical protein AB6A40_005915 [Gnathostoma spinigerum]|uniref:Uncharacterized protein n=1 Tax=Gnathostoma spinigerum TaxID=75299 RepID=A0ABD6EHK5_9BILA